MKKIVSMFMAAAMVMSLGACGSSDAGQQAGSSQGGGEDGVTTIKLMMSQTQEPGVSAAVEAFNKAYEGKYVCEADYLAFDNVFETLEILMSSQSSEYDVFAADGPNIAAYAQRGYLTPLTDYFTTEEVEMFTPPMQVEAFYNGEMYGAPMGDSSLVLYYNTALLEQAGIDYDFSALNGENRITWEELVKIAEQAQSKLDPDGSKGIFGIEFQQVGRTYQMNVLANDFGGENIGADGFTVDGVFNGEPWQKALNWYQDQVDAGVFTKGINASDTSSYFMSGKIIFYLGTTAMPGTFDSNGFTDYGYTYVPCFEGYENEVTTSCGSWTVGINPYSEKTEAAVEFIKYLCLYDGSDVYIDVSGMVPAVSRQFTDELLAAKPYLEIAQYEGANTALVRAITPGFNEYATAVNALWENVRNGADPAQAAEDCISELNTAFMEYR
ncbi:MAG: extracellular solute-binding protein [Eubacteriales bacterium]|nr:extracellular solute-binding protein [Eubacteriales bacterium]